MGPLVNGSNQNLIKTTFAFGLSLILIGIAIYQAITESLTHDECITYQYYVHRTYWNILAWERPWTNNHILNTLFMKLGQDLFGHGELQLRLHSVIGLGAFLFGVHKLIRPLPLALYVSAFVLVGCLTYTLDFFSLARGYGIALALMVLSIYCLIRYLESGSIKHQVIGLILAFLAFYANLIMLHFLVAYGILALLLSPAWHFADRSLFHRARRIILPMLLVGLAILPIAFPLLSRLLVYKMDFVAAGNFWIGTIESSLNSEFADGNLERFVGTMRYVLQGSALITALISIVLLISGLWTKHRGLVVINTIFWILVGFSFLMNELRGTGFPEPRMSTHIMFLIMLNMVLLIHFISQKLKAVQVIPVLVALAVAFNFAQNWNHPGLADWKFNRYDKAVIEEVKADIAALDSKREKVYLTTQPLFTPVLEHYRRKTISDDVHGIADRVKSDSSEYAYITHWNTNEFPTDEWVLVRAFQPPSVHNLIKRVPKEGQ